MVCKFTPLNESYDSCCKCFVEFVINVTKDTTLIKDILELTSFDYKGHGVYVLSSERFVLSKDLRHHLDFLLKEIYLFKNSILALKSQGINLYFSCTWCSYGSGGPVLWPNQLNLIAELDLACYFNFIYMANNEMTNIMVNQKIFENNDDCHVELAIYSDSKDFDPHKITKELNIQPTELNIVGTEVTNSLGRKRVVKKSSWILSSAISVPSNKLADHLNWLLGELNNTPIKFDQLQTEDIALFIKFVWYTSLNNSCVLLEPQQIKLMANFDIEYAFDVYFDNFF